MTIQEILSSTADTLSPDDIADILGSDPATLRLMVRNDPEALAPLQPIRTGNRVKFPRMRFLYWYFGEQQTRRESQTSGTINPILMVSPINIQPQK